MRNLILLVLFTLQLAGCASITPQQRSHFPPGTISEQRNERETIYYYPPPKPIEEPGTPTHHIIPTYQPKIPPVKVALLVPLTGEYEKLGKALLDAAQLAMFNLQDPNLILLPFDTKGTSYGAVDATKEAALQDVKLILGPIFSKSAKAIVPIAAEHQINFVSFSNDKSLEGTGAFAIGFLPEQQIRRVVDFAMYQGIEEFATVVPNNAYGGTAAKELRETVAENEEASVLKTEIYRISQNGNPVKLKSHVFSAFNALMNNKPPKDFDEELEQYNENPINFPRGLLIPDTGKSLRNILALLKKYQLDPTKIQLLGSGQWYTPDTLDLPLLQGAWFASPPRERRVRFESEFNDTYGYQPPQLSSLAYDGIALAATLARISNGTDFTRNALTNPRGFIGIDGIFRLKTNGLTERGLAVMQVQQGEFVVVDPAPNSFFEIVKHEYPKKEETENIEAVEETTQNNSDSPASGQNNTEVEEGTSNQESGFQPQYQSEQPFPSSQPRTDTLQGIGDEIPLYQEKQRIPTNRRRPSNQDKEMLDQLFGQPKY